MHHPCSQLLLRLDLIEVHCGIHWLTEAVEGAASYAALSRNPLFAGELTGARKVQLFGPVPLFE